MGSTTVQQQSIFREKALARLSSPEQLDQVMQVTPLRGWLALLALAVVVAAAVAWGIFGSIPVEINTQGIMLGADGIRRLVAPTAGGVTEHKRGGDVVKKGDVIASLKVANGKDVDITSDLDGMVVETYVHTGFTVREGGP